MTHSQRGARRPAHSLAGRAYRDRVCRGVAWAEEERNKGSWSWPSALGLWWVSPPEGLVRRG